MLAAFVAACDHPGPSDVERELVPEFASSPGPVLVECPTDSTVAATGTIGALGGTVEAAGSRITLPTGAVRQPTDITVRVPTSNYMEIEIRANGRADFEFHEPVTVAIDYGRCTRSNIDKDPLSAWEIDPETKALIENLGGSDDKDARIVEFSTGHLSAYAVAQ